jgi:hypothetical protein
MAYVKCSLGLAEGKAENILITIRKIGNHRGFELNISLIKLEVVHTICVCLMCQSIS